MLILLAFCLVVSFHLLMVVFTFSILFKCRRLHSVVVELQMFRAACFDLFQFFFVLIVTITHSKVPVVLGC